MIPQKGTTERFEHDIPLRKVELSRGPLVTIEEVMRYAEVPLVRSGALVVVA